MTKRNQTIFYWTLRIIAAVILLQTLFFKFSAAPESVYIFSTLGMEPWGRIATGVVELVASVLILYPRTTAFGALTAIGVMGGAIFFHFIRLGIQVQNDKGQLFIYAVIVMISSILLLIRFRAQLLFLFSNKPSPLKNA